MEADWEDGARPFQCQSCDKKYLRKNNLEDHVLMEHPDTDQVENSAGCRVRSSVSLGSVHTGIDWSRIPVFCAGCAVGALRCAASALRFAILEQGECLVVVACLLCPVQSGIDTGTAVAQPQPQPQRPCSVRCTVLHCLHCGASGAVPGAVYSVKFTMYSVQCTVYSAQSTVYSEQCTVTSVQCSAVHTAAALSTQSTGQQQCGAESLAGE